MKKVLVVVSTEADRISIRDLLDGIFPEFIESALSIGHTYRINMRHGVECTVWSVERWTECTTCGAMFDQIVYLVNPVPKFVELSLRTCVPV
jgi:hypothetical protein